MKIEIKIGWSDITLPKIAMVWLAIAMSTLPDPFRTVYLAGFLIDLVPAMYIAGQYMMSGKAPPIMQLILHAQLWPLWLVRRALRGSWLIIKRRRA